MIEFDLFIYNKQSDFGDFGLLVIYNKNQIIPLIKEVIDEEVDKIYKYCITNNIDTLNSRNYKQHTSYMNFVNNKDGYSQMSGLYLETFYLEIFIFTKLKLYSYFNCAIIFDNIIEEVSDEQLNIIPSDRINFYNNVQEYVHIAKISADTLSLDGKSYSSESIENYFLSNELVIYKSKYTNDIKQSINIELDSDVLKYLIVIYTNDTVIEVQNKIKNVLAYLNNRSQI